MVKDSNFMEVFSLIFHSKIKTVIIAFILLSGIILAQANKIILTGNHFADIRQIVQMPSEQKLSIPADEAPKKKSVALAGIMSAIVPGAGEFYSEDYLKSALFFGIEAAAVIIGVSYDKKGNDQTAVFQDFANQNWDVKRYADWTVANARKINPNVDIMLLNVYDGEGNIVWRKLNDLENAIGQGTNYYSHRLAYKGEQQYYEMIGKYQQFKAGWNDFVDTENAYQYEYPLSPNFHLYSEERGKANDYYNIASKAVIVIISNHVISMFDAIWTAASFNKSIQMNVTLQKEQLGYRTEYSTVLNLKYNF